MTIACMDMGQSMSKFNDFDEMIKDFYYDFGFEATYVKRMGTVSNDEDGTVAAITEEFPVEAIKMEMNGFGTRPGTSIQEGDQQLYVRPTEKVDEFADALDVNPTSDSIKINGVLWKIVTVKEYTPDARNNILYEMYIRR